jgi:hypothetical protein
MPELPEMKISSPSQSPAIGDAERKERVLHAQELVRKYIPEGVSLSDELIADRRGEAGKSSR